MKEPHDEYAPPIRLLPWDDSTAALLLGLVAVVLASEEDFGAEREQAVAGRLPWERAHGKLLVVVLEAHVGHPFDDLGDPV